MNIREIVLDDLAKYELLLQMGVMDEKSEKVVLDVLLCLRSYLKTTRQIAALEVRG